MLDAVRVYALLQEACRALEDADEHAISAYVGQSMAMIEQRFGIGIDHISSRGD